MSWIFSEDKMETCIRQAIKIGDNLFPDDCMEILEKNYGKSLDRMRSETIYKKISDLMGVYQDYTGDPQMEKEIIDTINSWMEDYETED